MLVSNVVDFIDKMASLSDKLPYNEAICADGGTRTPMPRSARS